MDIKADINEKVNQINHEAKSRAFRAANELRNSALTVLRGQRSGRVYRRPFAKGTYTASAPGEPPRRSGDHVEAGDQEQARKAQGARRQ